MPIHNNTDKGLTQLRGVPAGEVWSLRSENIGTERVLEYEYRRANKVSPPLHPQKKRFWRAVRGGGGGGV